MQRNKLLGWLSVGFSAAGIVIMPFPDVPIFRFFFGSFGLWVLGAAIGMVALSIEGTDRKLAGWGVTLNILGFPVCLLYTMLFIFSPH